MTHQTILIATLGGQPQIITFTLDLLLKRGEPVDQVVVVYLASNPRYYQAYLKLQGEFVADRYAGRPCHLRGLPIRIGDNPLADIETSAQIEFVHNTFYQLLRELKNQGNRIHLSLSSGRRMMALVALEAAMQYLAPTDCIWHLYTTPEFTRRAKEEQLMHAPTEEDTQLLAVPFVPWAAYFPGLRPLLEQTPRESREAAAGWLDKDERARCQQVWRLLTPRQREALRAFADGLTRSQVADQLGIAISTVDAHRNVILQQCQAAWGEAGGQEVNLRFIQQRFNLFLKGLDLV